MRVWEGRRRNLTKVKDRRGSSKRRLQYIPLKRDWNERLRTKTENGRVANANVFILLVHHVKERQF